MPALVNCGGMDRIYSVFILEFDYFVGDFGRSGSLLGFLLSCVLVVLVFLVVASESRLVVVVRVFGLDLMQ